MPSSDSEEKEEGAMQVETEKIVEGSESPRANSIATGTGAGERQESQKPCTAAKTHKGTDGFKRFVSIEKQQKHQKFKQTISLLHSLDGLGGAHKLPVHPISYARFCGSGVTKVDWSIEAWQAYMSDSGNWNNDVLEDFMAAAFFRYQGKKGLYCVRTVVDLEKLGSTEDIDRDFEYTLFPWHL